MSTTTIHTARKTRLCGSTHNLNEHTIDAGHLYLRHIAFPGDEGFEEGSGVWVIEECALCADYGGDWIRSHYGVPAAIGGRVSFAHDAHTGTIVSFRGGCLDVIFDGERGTTPLDPREVNYLDDAGHAIDHEGATR